MKTTRGFTLLELLLALSVFSLLVVMAFQAINTLLESDRNMRDQQAALQNFQRAWMYLERDIRQIIPRTRNTGFEVEPALQLHSADGALLNFTRAGNPDIATELRPNGQMRSTLQRIQYRLENKTLVRRSWNLVDAVADDVPVTLPLMNGVSSIQVQAMPALDGAWQPQNDEKELPIALEITLEHEAFGKVSRVFLLYIRKI